MASVFGAAGVAYNKADVFEFGSQHWILRKVTDTTGAGSDDWAHGPVRVKFAITPSTSKKEVEFEDGEKKTTRTTTNYQLVITGAQKDSAALVALMDTAGSDTCQFILEGTPGQVGSAGKRSYITCMGTAADPPAVSSDAAPEYKFDLEAATGAISIALASVTMHTGQTTGFGSTTGSIVQASGKFFGITSLS